MILSMITGISKILVLILIVFGLFTVGFLTYGATEAQGKPGVSEPIKIKPSHPIKPEKPHISKPIR